MRAFIGSLAVFLAVSSSAVAETVLSTGLMFGSAAGAIVDCSLINLGTKPVTVVSQAIDVTVKGNLVAPAIDTCTEPLAAAGTCAFSYTNGATASLGGVFRIKKGNAKLVRGFCSLRISGVFEVRETMQ